MTTTKSSRPAGWYWIRKTDWDNKFTDWTPALWKPEFKSWYSANFSGIPDCEVIVDERLKWRGAFIKERLSLLQRAAAWFCVSFGHARPNSKTAAWEHDGVAFHQCERCGRIASTRT